MAGKDKPKTGGREAGTSNKRTQEVMECLEALECDPIEGIVRIARQAENEENLALAGQMYKEIAQYVAPKRKSIEIDASHYQRAVHEMPDAELTAIIAQGQNQQV